MPSALKNFLRVLLLTSLFAVVGCNIYDSVDDPEDDVEKLDNAKALMDEGKCEEALRLFQGRTNLSNEEYHTKGWAEMCTGGATLTNIAKNMFGFTSSTNNLEMVGKMGNAMVPQNDVKVETFSAARNTFNNITEERTRVVDTTLAILLKISAILAKNASNNGAASQITRADISDNCTANCTNCTNTTIGISDTDVDAIRTLITSASVTAGSVAGLGSVASLSSRLNTLVPPAAASAVTRCVIYSQFFTE